MYEHFLRRQDQRGAREDKEVRTRIKGGANMDQAVTVTTARIKGGANMDQPVDHTLSASQCIKSEMTVSVCEEEGEGERVWESVSE